MINSKSRRLMMAVCLFLVAVFAVVGMNISVSTAFADSASDYFTANAAKVYEIDAEANYFAKLKDAGNLAKMQDEVAVAEAYNALVAAYPEADYEAAEYAKIEQAIGKTKVAVKITADNYTSFDKTAFLDKISETETSLADVVKAADKFAAYVEAAEAQIVALYDKALAVNTANPDGDAYINVGFYDETGVNELTSKMNAALTAVENVSYDKANAGICRQAVDACVQDAKTAMNVVCKNDIERARNLLSYYRAVANGDVEDDVDVAKEAAIDAISALDEYFWDNCSTEIVKEYSADKSDFEKFYAKQNDDGSTVGEYKLSSITTDDGIVTIVAYNADGEEVNVFPDGATLGVQSATSSSARRNAQTEIKKIDKNLSVAYFVYVKVFNGGVMWDDSKVPEGTVFEITIDLNNYYENYAINNGPLDSIISNNVPFLAGTWGIKDKKDVIVKTANEYMSGAESSLCYLYASSKGVGSVTPLEYTLDNDGILSFTTTTLNNFAVTAANDETIFANPMFWVILVAALIVLIIVLCFVFKFARYKVKFYSNGGTKVRKTSARKGQCFVMPANPTREGFVFAGWYEDKKLTKRFIATKIVKRKRLKAYAKWALALTPERINDYFARIRTALASHAQLGEGSGIPEGEQKTLAKVIAGTDEIKLYLALETSVLETLGYDVVAVKEEENAATPSLFIVNSRETFFAAMQLVAKLIEAFSLAETDVADETLIGTEQEYVFTVSNTPAVVEEPATEEVAEEGEQTEEQVEEATEETTEEGEQAEEQPAEEEVAEEPAAEEGEEGVTDEQLNEYFKQIRAKAASYALYTDNDTVEDGMMLLKLYKKSDAVYCYLALDKSVNEALEASVGLGFGDTPSVIKVNSDELLATALELVEKNMVDHGLEISDDEVALGENMPAEGKGYAFKLHYNEDAE